MGNSTFSRASSHLHDLCGLVERPSLNWMTTQRLWVILQIRECWCDWEAWPLPCVVVQTSVRGEVWGLCSAGWSGRAWGPPTKKRAKRLTQYAPTLVPALHLSVYPPSFPSMYPNWHPELGTILPIDFLESVQICKHRQLQYTLAHHFYLPLQGTYMQMWFRTDPRSCRKRAPISTGISDRKNDSENMVSPTPQLYWDIINI